MSEILINSIVIGCLAAFFITLAKKWGVVEHLQVMGNDLISEMAHCDFCMSWWACVVLTLVYIFFTGDTSMVWMPFIGTMVSRRLL